MLSGQNCRTFCCCYYNLNLNFLNSSSCHGLDHSSNYCKHCWNNHSGWNSAPCCKPPGLFLDLPRSPFCNMGCNSCSSGSNCSSSCWKGNKYWKGYSCSMNACSSCCSANHCMRNHCKRNHQMLTNVNGYEPAFSANDHPNPHSDLPNDSGDRRRSGPLHKLLVHGQEKNTHRRGFVRSYRPWSNW